MDSIIKQNLSCQKGPKTISVKLELGRQAWTLTIMRATV